MTDNGANIKMTNVDDGGTSSFFSKHHVGSTVLDLMMMATSFAMKRIVERSKSFLYIIDLNTKLFEYLRITD